jgi:hypothetical protein
MFPKLLTSFIPLSNMSYASGYLLLHKLVSEVPRKALWPVSLIVLGAPCFYLQHLDRVNFSIPSDFGIELCNSRTKGDDASGLP